MTRVVVSLALAVAWLTAGVLIPLEFHDREDLLPVAWVAYLMGVFNLVKAWVQYRSHKRRAAAWRATQRPYRIGEAPPVRRTP
jgi:hypothetical protein